MRTEDCNGRLMTSSRMGNPSNTFESAGMNSMRLVEIKNCPVCGGTEREPSDGMTRRKLQGLHYIKHAAAALGISVEELVELVNTFRCLSCGSYFCDPWLSPEMASALFCASAPDHIVGWANFEHWLYPRRNNIIQTRNQRLYAAVTRKIGSLSSYAEFGCPFQGFLLQLTGYETTPGKRISLFAQALYREPDIRWTKITRIHNAAQRWCSRLAVLGLRVRAVLVALAVIKGVLNKRGKIADRQVEHEEIPVASLPKQRYLLTQDTTKGWGSNCVRYGASCQYFAHTVLGADVIPMDEAHRNGFPRFDLIGIFNILDHTTFPMDVIRKSLELTDHVLIVTHHATHAGKQHLFALSDDFAAWLNKSLEGISTEDLHNEVDVEGTCDYNYFLLSRKNVGQ